MTIGEEAVVANAMEAVRQRVQQEATDGLVGVERHDPSLHPRAVASRGVPIPINPVYEYVT